VGDITAAVAGLAERGVVFLRYDSMDQDAGEIGAGQRRGMGAG
jgi:hypothetical protein